MMGVFCDSLKLCSTAALRLPDWPKQRQILQKRALIPTRLVGQTSSECQTLNSNYEWTLRLNKVEHKV